MMTGKQNGTVKPIFEILNGLNFKCTFYFVLLLVGAGTAGSVVASRLSEIPCVRVLLLEAGKPPPLLTEVPAFGRAFWFTDIDWAYKTAPQKYTGNLLKNRVRNFGLKE